MSQGKRPHTFMTMKDARAYFKQLYNADQYKLKFSNNKHGGDSTPSSTKSTTKRRRNNGSSNHEKRSSSAKLCRLCKRGGHDAADCWTAENNKSKRPKNYKNHRKSNERTCTRSGTSALISKAVKKMRAEKTDGSDKKKKRKMKRVVLSESDDDSSMDAHMLNKLEEMNLDSNNDSFEFSDYHAFPFQESLRPTKRLKTIHYT